MVGNILVLIVQLKISQVLVKYDIIITNIVYTKVYAEIFQGERPEIFVLGDRRIMNIILNLCGNRRC